MGIDLSGRVAVVTGGGKGVGRLFAEELVAAGAKVALVGRTAATLAATAGDLQHGGATVTTAVADVTDRIASRAAIAAINEQFGPIDLLVNNAGVAGLGRITEIDLDTWWHAFEINLKATMAWCQDVVPQMIERGGGRIINVTSSAANWTVPGGSAYIASKAGVSAFTRVLDAELRPKGVLTFAIAPRLRSDMTDEIQTSPAIPEAFRAAASKTTQEELDGRRERTAALIRRIIAGELDEHAGQHLETESPPA
ncbi:MAG: SDR family NAD(P)-dependent oxidoreductase [Acidimicrobiia bacterium]